MQCLLDTAACCQNSSPCQTTAARLDEVLLNAAGGGDQHVDHTVLHQEAHVLPHARRYQVRREPQKDLGARAPPLAAAQARVRGPGQLVAQAPCYLALARGQKATTGSCVGITSLARV